MVIWIFLLFEVYHSVLYAFLFLKLSHMSLFYLKAFFLFGCLYHVTIFETSLVWSASCISWSYRFLQPTREIIQLQRMMAHSVHILPPLRILILLKYTYSCALIQLIFWILVVLSDKNFWVPIALNFKEILYFLILVDSGNLTVNLEHFFCKPATFGERELTLEIWVTNEPYFWIPSNITVWCTNNQIMRTHGRWCDFILLRMLFKLNIRFILLSELHCLSRELSNRFIIGP